MIPRPNSRHYVQIGTNFGQLTVSKIMDHPFVECRCDCGGSWTGKIKDLKRRARTCGHNRGVHLQTHQGSSERLYNCWRAMKQRCLDRNSESWERYGGRGISICPLWISSFPPFRTWALERGYTDDLTLDRIDNDGDYSPANCRWADRTTQARNSSATKLTVESAKQIRIRLRLGEGQRDIAADYGVSQTTISRIKLGKIWV